MELLKFRSVVALQWNLIEVTVAGAGTERHPDPAWLRY